MKIVAVTSCPVGLAHTYMAAESLKKAAVKRGITIKVETQGAMGIENKLTSQEIKEADIVIIAADVSIQNSERFQGKLVMKENAGKAIKKGDDVIQRAVDSVTGNEPQ